MECVFNDEKPRDSILQIAFTTIPAGKTSHQTPVLTGSSALRAPTGGRFPFLWAMYYMLSVLYSSLRSVCQKQLSGSICDLKFWGRGELRVLAWASWSLCLGPAGSSCLTLCLPWVCFLWDSGLVPEQKSQVEED